MLPDFPGVREQANKLLGHRFQQQVAAGTGVMREIRTVVMHEGHRMELHRADGSTERRSLKKMGTTISIRTDDLARDGLQAVLAAMDVAATDLADKQSSFFYARLDETIDEAGQSLDAGGRPFTWDVLLEGLEIVDIDFDVRGQPMWPTLMCGRALYETAQKWVLTDDHERKYKELVERKRIAWREREGDRKLVS